LRFYNVIGADLRSIHDIVATFGTLYTVSMTDLNYRFFHLTVFQVIEISVEHNFFLSNMWCMYWTYLIKISYAFFYRLNIINILIQKYQLYFLFTE